MLIIGVRVLSLGLCPCRDSRKPRGVHLARANRNSTTRLGPAEPVLGLAGAEPLFLLLPAVFLAWPSKSPHKRALRDADRWAGWSWLSWADRMHWPQVGTLHFALSHQLPTVPAASEGRKIFLLPLPILFYGWRSELVQVTTKSLKPQAML